MKNSFARLGLVVIVLFSVASVAQAAHRRAKIRHKVDPRQTSIAALSPAGRDTFLIVARDGVIQVGLKGGRVQKVVARDARRIRLLRDRADRLRHPQLTLNEPVAQVGRRLESVRFLNDTAWTAMNLLVSLRLDNALASGRYKFVILSDARSYVLFRQGARTGRAAHGYTGIRMAMGSRTGAVNRLLSRLGYDRKDGVMLEVAELPRPTKRSLTASSLMQRVKNRRIGDSPVLERLIAVQRGA